MPSPNSFRYALIDNAAVAGPAVRIGPGGLHSFSIVGTFGGASIKLQLRGGDDITYVDIPDAVFTAAGVTEVYLPASATVRVVVTGGSPSALYARLSLVD